MRAHSHVTGIRHYRIQGYLEPLRQFDLCQIFLDRIGIGTCLFDVGELGHPGRFELTELFKITCRLSRSI